MIDCEFFTLLSIGLLQILILGLLGVGGGGKDGSFICFAVPNLAAHTLLTASVGSFILPETLSDWFGLLLLALVRSY